jgi:GDSL-like Lipase/Acylhydrolase
MTATRRTYRPTLTDPLEERLVLAHGAAIHVHAIHAAALMAKTPPPIPFVGPVGTLGDSYSDEYKFYTPDRSTARNWVEILHDLRGVGFGPYSVKGRSEPRNQGFAFDWARSGATSDTMIANQLSGLASQAAQNKVQYASIFIGGNDYLNFLFSVQAGAVPPSQVPAGLAQITENAARNVGIAVDTLLASSPNLKIVLFTLPAVSNVPLAHALGATPQGQALLAATDQAVAAYDGLLKQIAASNPRIAILDLAAVVSQISATGGAPISFGGATVDFTNPRDDYHSFFLGDAYHPGTIGQGIIADEFAITIDNAFGAQLFPPTPGEIVKFAAKVQRLVVHNRPSPA